MKKKNKAKRVKGQGSRVKRAASKRHCEEILCAGFGGQGIMLMGKLLAQAGLISGKHVTWMPSYGAEVRGGTAYSMVKISSAEIANPIVTNPDRLVVMNEPSFLKYKDKLREGGVLIANRSLIDKVSKAPGTSLVSIPMTEMASRLGNIRSANMIALGAVVKRSRMLTMKNVVAALKMFLKNKEELFLLNRKALEAGHRY